MPPEIIELAKLVVPPALTGLGGILFGRAKKQAEIEALRQKNKDSEFARMEKLLDEVQSERDRSEERLLRLEIRLGQMEEQHAKEKAGYEEKITRLEQRVAELEKENAALKAPLIPAAYKPNQENKANGQA